MGICKGFPESSAKGSSTKNSGFALRRSQTPRHSLHSTYTAHIHHSTYTAPLTYTTPQHLPRPPTPHHSTYTADIHHVQASILLSLISKAGVGLAGVGGMHPSAGFVRVGALSLWRRANSKARRRTLCGFRARLFARAVAPCVFSRLPANPLRVSCVSKR